MKKLTTIRFSNKPNLLTMLVLLGGMLIATAQTPGIPYQAYIIDTKGGYVPGEQIKLPLVNADIVLQFEIRNDKGQVEYIEQIPVKTDEFGMVSTVIGVGVLGSKPVMGKFSDIKWDGTPKKMHTDIDFSGSGTQFQDHGKMDIIYIPSPGSGLETVTSLAYNGDGSYTYTSEDGTTTTFSVPQHGGGDPNTLSMAGNVGDIYVDESSGDMYMHGGTSWVPMNSLNKGTGAPTATNPANPNGGDVYVDESTGDLYTYDGTKWIRQPEAKVTTSPGLPTATNPANPQPGDVYVDQSTGDVYTYNSTTNTWVNKSDVVSADTGNIIVEGTDGLAYLSSAGLGLETGVGAPTATNPANPDAGDVYVDESTGDIYTYDGTEWIRQPEAKVTTNPGLPTATDPANPQPGDIYVDQTTGDVYTYNSTTNTWVNKSDVVSADTGNIIVEGTDGLAYLSSAGLGLETGVGAPTATNPANPDAGDVYVDESTGDIYTYDGTEWIRQPEAKVTTNPGLPTATDPANPQPGDIYVDQTTGDVYTYNSTTNTWENQSFINANNGLTATGDLVQLGGNLIQPTAIGTDATNTLAVTGLENADMTTNQYDVMVVNNTTGVLEKTKVSALNIQRYIASYTATRGDDEFDTPQNILKVENIDAYRNGVRIDFVQVDADTIRLDLAAIGGCFPGDEIRIVQLQ